MKFYTWDTVELEKGKGGKEYDTIPYIQGRLVKAESNGVLS